MSPAHAIPRKLFFVIIPGAIVLYLLLCAAYILFWPQRIEDHIRKAVTDALADRFKADVDLKGLHIRLFANPNVTGQGLSLRFPGRSDVPPLLQIETFSFRLGFLGLLGSVKHIPLLRVQNMLITIPPREARPASWRPVSSPATNPVPKIVIDRVICDDTDIRILPKQKGKDPLDWDIHNLLLIPAGVYKPFLFHGHLTNGKPKGEIDTDGQFGPWNADDPGGTPVSGQYKFTDADLGPLPGIAGSLSSTGKYSGLLAELEVEGQTDTPNFSLDKVGKPVPLHTEFSATVDGTNGDTYLHPVNATLVRSLIIAQGRVVREPQKQGHLISIDVTVPNGRIQDFLSLAINSNTPFLTGPVKIKAKLILPPGSEHVIEKMILDGQFGVEDANWSSAALREKLESLSRHAQGKPEDEDIGSSISDLQGNFLLRNGVLHFRRLRFSVEGAAVDLTGTYALRNGDLDFAGHLRLQAKLSQTMSGSKSIFLKAFDPFFQKGGSGTFLPIRISGTRENPVFGVTVFHKTFDKHFGENKHGL
jgi:hypothetical protein